MSAPRQRSIVLLGMMTKMPVAGVVWQTLHYLLGFQRLGYEVFYVESHARTPSMFMERETDDGSARACAFISKLMRRFGLGDRWAYVALHDDGACHGMSRERLERVYRSAEVVLNLHGGTQPLPEHGAGERLVYLETDPVQLQLELYDERPETIAFLEHHCAFFTFAESYATADCLLPVSDRFDFHPTRQPVVLDLWQGDGPPGEAFTTVANWRQPWRDVSFRGETYGWSKDREFLKLLDLPAKTRQPLELALSGHEDQDRQLLETHGWRVRDGLALSIEIDSYRSYIAGSRAEFTVAKDQNVRLRSGWFSDRSATYLAAGRPVVMQDTGFGSALPTGEGLFAFAGEAAALAAIETVNADYERHSTAARDIAREHFEAEGVLRRLLAEIGIEQPHARGRRGAAPAFPTALDLQPRSRRPTVLAEPTAASVLGADVERLPARRASGSPRASVVVVSWDGLAFTRLCLESLIAHTEDDAELEVVVVDNGSSDGTRGYLRRLAASQPCVRVELADGNLGFPAAANRGLALARGELLILLNNDTIVPPGWLSRLSAHLEDEAVGAVGPVTNRIGNEAEVEVSYRTFGEYLSAAERRAREHARESSELPMPAMFCVALRRETWQRLGPLDEGFGIGTLEDDDYAMRLREAGLRTVCAEDVLLHHFGEASFGRLAPNGDYAALLEANRRRFKDKWSVEWRPYDRRANGSYAALKGRIRAAVAEAVPERSTVVVVTRGDDELLALGERTGWHFPQTPDGVYAGHHPSDGADAVAQLEAVRERGGEFLVVPRTSFWWLEHYDALRERLDARYSPVLVDPDSCAIYSLEELNARD